MLNHLNNIIVVVTVSILVGCAGTGGTGDDVYSSSVHTMGDTIDLATFKGVVELNTDAISGEVKHNPLLRLNVEENIAKALRDKYNSMGSYSVFLMTASEAELRMNNHRALRDRGYTHLLIAALNPEISLTDDADNSYVVGKQKGKASTHSLSMAISCTIYRLSDGMPVSLVNADVYKIGKDYWGRKAIKRTGTISERWQLGPIYSCDQALKAVTS